MFNPQRLIVASLFVLVLAGATMAQEHRAPIDNLQTPVPAAPLVTVTATAKRVRFVNPGTVVQLRLEVYNEAGQKLFDTELRGGNVLDWHLQDGAGERVAPGSYATVLTIKSLSGRLSQRVGLVTVDDKKAAVEAAGAGELSRLSMAQQQTIGPVEGNSAFKVMPENEKESMTAVTHDGQDGQLTSTSGALTFRTGNVFAGKDKEQMRLTEAGNLGIGTQSPQAKLDVAGEIRTSGIEFVDGTDGKLTKLTTTATGALQQTLADGTVVENVSGTGTQNRVTKWIDNVGTLADSTITEVSGRVGIGATNPSYKLVVGPDIGAGLTTSDLTVSRGAGQSVSAFIGASGANGMNFGWDQGNTRAFVNAPVLSPIVFTHGGVSERMRIATNGNIGIGTTNPTAKLDVVGTTKVSSNLTVDTNTLHVDATNDRVGIGTTTPQAKLHVVGNVNFVGFRTEVTAGTPNVIGGATSSVITAGVTGATIGGGRSHSVLDNSGTIGGGEQNVVGGNSGGTCCDPGATVGGGTRNRAEGAFATVAGGDLNVAAQESATVGGGAGNDALNSFSTISGGLSNSTPGPFGTVGGGEANNATEQYSTIGGGKGNTASGQHSTVPGGVENTAQGTFSFAAGRRARALHQGSFVWSDSTVVAPDFFSSTLANQFLINATGGVGIGTNFPLASLHVLGASSTATAPVAVLASSGDEVPLAFRSGSTFVARIRANDLGNLVFATLNGTDKNIFFRAGDDTSTDMFIESSTGNVGIGTVSPDARLDVNGFVKIAPPPGGTGAALCRDATFGLIVDCSASSARYKQNIFSLRTGLAVVERLRPVSFTWKANGQRDIGLVAEEVNRVEPLLATRNAAGDVKGVRYDRLGVVLLNAVQEQQAQIKMQQQQLRVKDARITKLEARLARLDARLATLDQRLRRGRTAHQARHRR